MVTGQPDVITTQPLGLHQPIQKTPPGLQSHPVTNQPIGFQATKMNDYNNNLLDQQDAVEPKALIQNQWSQGLFGCFSNIGMCIVVFIVPCWAVGKNAEKVIDI